MSTADDPQPGVIRVEVAYATSERQVLLSVELTAGSTLEQAIDLSGIRAEFPGMEVDLSAVGIFGRKMPPGQVLRDGDRVEIYRPLIADPKDARRRRAEQEKPV